MAGIVVTGASGLLGRALMQELAAYAPIGTALRRAGAGLTTLDLLDREATTAFLNEQHPAAIIHAAAERRPDVGERDPEGTRALNVEATRYIARTARALGSWVLYLSTDYVFDGTAPPYDPDSTPHPLNLYGRTKLDGEQTVLAETGDAAVLRVGLLYGRVEYLEESSVTALVQDVRGGESKGLDDWQQRYPTYVDDLAVLCRQMLELRLAGESMNGIWHWCGDERLTKYAMARVIGRLLGVSTAHLRPDASPGAGTARPHDCRLDCSRLERRGLGRRTPFAQALARVLQESKL